MTGGSELHYPSTENADAVAAELLGVHLAGDPEVLEFLNGRLFANGEDKPVVREAPLIALCEGWPESEELRGALRVLHENQQGLSYVAYFQLVSIKYDSENLLEDMRNMLLAESGLQDRSRNAVGRVARPLLRRLRTDDGFRTLMEGRLRNVPTASEKATLPRLIASTQGVTAYLRAWCTAEIDAQTRRISPEVGFDLSAGDLRPVAHSLLSVLDVRSEGL